MGFIGAKGGVGTTTTALNIALALVAQGRSVIYVELRPSFGTLACHLNQRPHANLSRLLELPPEQIGTAELDAALSQSLTGLRVLFGPQEVTEFKDAAPKQVGAIVKGLSSMADYVVLDLPNQPSAATQAAVHLCHFVAVVTEREPSSVLAGKVTVDQLHAWGGGNLVGAIIVNRTIYPVTMESSEIQSRMGCPIVGLVPSAATACLRALRDGLPLVISQPDDEAALSLVEISGRIAGDKLTALHL